MGYDRLRDLVWTAKAALADLSEAAEHAGFVISCGSTHDIDNGRDVFTLTVSGSGKELAFAAEKSSPYMGGWTVRVSTGEMQPMHLPQFLEDVQRGLIPTAGWLGWRLSRLKGKEDGATRRKEVDSIRMELRKLPAGEALGVVRGAEESAEEWLE